VFYEFHLNRLLTKVKVKIPEVFLKVLQNK